MGATLEILLRLDRGEITLVEAAKVLGLHRSSVWRKLKLLRARGAASLRHGLSGRPSNRRAKGGVRERAISVFRELSEERQLSVAEIHREMTDVHGLRLSYQTLTRWLRSEGITQMPARPRQRVAGETVVVMRVEGYVPTVVVDRATRHVVGCSRDGGYQGLKQALTAMVERAGLPMRLLVDQALLAMFTPGERRNLRALCDRLGMSFGPSNWRVVELRRDELQAQGSAFVRVGDDRWRQLLE